MGPIKPPANPQVAVDHARPGVSLAEVRASIAHEAERRIREAKPGPGGAR
jgi:hypothetical protein